MSTMPNWDSWASHPYLFDGDEWGWEVVNAADAQNRGILVFDDYVFGSVPSQNEVEDAISSLKQTVASALPSQFYEDRSSYNWNQDLSDHSADSAKSVLDWNEPTMHLYDERLSRSHQYGSVYEAFHLLQTEPSVQRMVTSLSSDQAIWDAVLNNEVVKEFKESFCIAQDANSQVSVKSLESPKRAANILEWVFNNSKTKVLELIEKLRNLLNEILKSPQKGKKASATKDLLESRLRTSLLLTVVVVLIVVVTRAHRI